MLFFEKYAGTRVHKALTKCGSFSYELFLCHWTFLIIIAAYVDWLPLRMVLALVIPCVAAYLIHRLSKAVLDRYNKALDSV